MSNHQIREHKKKNAYTFPTQWGFGKIRYCARPTSSIKSLLDESGLSRPVFLQQHLESIWSGKKKPVGCLKRVTGIHGTANIEYSVRLSLMMLIQIQNLVIRSKRMLFIGVLRRRWTLFDIIFFASLNLHAILRSYVFPSLSAHWEPFPYTRGNLIYL